MMKIAFIAAASMLCLLRAVGAHAQTPEVFVSPQCGSASNLFECARFDQSSQTTETITAFQVNVPSAGKLIVTWNGTAYCGTGDNPVPFTNYQVDFQLRGDARAPVLNGLGGGSVGESMRVIRFAETYGHERRQNYTLTPTRAFNVQPGLQTIRLMGKPNWKNSPVDAELFCLFNGGVMTALFVPN